MLLKSSPSEPGARVRRAFHAQAGFCERLGSPFTALLCRVLGDGLAWESETERSILQWRGDPGPFADSLPLRVAGALHYLVRVGRVPHLAALYPPHHMPEPPSLLDSVHVTLSREGDFVREFLRYPPQTNEVGRSAVLLAGWLEIAARTAGVLDVFEIGSSAGLNLIAERYRYRFGQIDWPGPVSSASVRPDSTAPLWIGCEWAGPSPPVTAALRVRSRRGCDSHPLDVMDPVQRQRLMAYVWADQRDRLERLDAAITLMRADPVGVDRCDAARWLEAVLTPDAEPGIVRVVCHSIVWSYLDPESQVRIGAHLAQVGAQASLDRPLAWLRLELLGRDEPAALRLTMWPGGEDEVLARAHPHGTWVRWGN